MKNKIIAHLSIIMILLGVFCNVCTTYNCISIYDNSVYAEADNWTSCDSSDLVTAFRYYCKSRNLAIEGSIADALTTFTTSTFNNICSTLGIDPTQLQAELKKTTAGNLGLRFLFSNTGITAYNRIFAEFLQNNDLNVGDEVDNKVIDSYETFNDDDGNTCSVFLINKSGQGSELRLNQQNKNLILKYGSSFKYSESDLYSLVPTYNQSNSYYNLTYNINSVVYSGSATSVYYSNRAYNVSYSNSTSGSVKKYDGLGYGYLSTDYGNPQKTDVIMLAFNDRYNAFSVPSYNVVGFPTVAKTTDNYYYIGIIGLSAGYGYYNNSSFTFRGLRIDNTDNKTGTDNITVTTNNTTINNNSYNNNYTIIYNDGDTYITDDDDEPLPTTPPDGGGGGGGGDNPTHPDIPPVDPTPTPDPTIPDWDIELPEMPTGNDWLLYGLEKKFPWDIPYNLMYMLSLFAADPETPHFEGTLDFKIVQWDYDIDLAPFDDIAGYVRDMEFIGFLLGLMLLTRKLIWG